MTRPAAGEPAAELRCVLPSLLAAVTRTRADEEALAQAMPRGTHAAALGDARRATLGALLEYAAAIEALSWPVPRSMLIEIRMHRILCDPRRPASER